MKDNPQSLIELPPFSGSQRRAISEMAKRPNKILLINAAFFTVFGALWLKVGYGGFLFSLHPPNNSEMVHSYWAFALVRQQGFFHLGAFNLVVAALWLVKYYKQQKTSHIIRLLVSSAQAKAD